MAEVSLSNYMLRSNDAMQNNPQRSMECFTTYIPQLNQVTEEFEVNWEVCLQASASSKTAVDEGFWPAHVDMVATTNSICNGYTACNQLESAMEFFQCNLVEVSLLRRAKYRSFFDSYEES